MAKTMKAMSIKQTSMKKKKYGIVVGGLQGNTFYSSKAKAAAAVIRIKRRFKDEPGLEVRIADDN